jgi:ParB family transcriptional regulator, chromosome partitioning protein
VLDLSSLDQFMASGLLKDPAGTPLELALDLIDFDPAQPRRRVSEERLSELAETIKAHGVLQPISVRPHPQQPGRYIVNYGERRVRASRMANRNTIPAFIEEAIDPYAQAIENLQREDLSPFDLAAFIAERERAGDTRATIAKRLGKPRSFITEVAELARAPAIIRQAHDDGRCNDVRTLYTLVRASRDNAAGLAGLLARGTPIRRDQAEALVGHVGPFRSQDATRAAPGKYLGRKRPLPEALLVEVEGRKAMLSWSTQPARTRAEVTFENGVRETVDLINLRLIAWMP